LGQRNSSSDEKVALQIHRGRPHRCCGGRKTTSGREEREHWLEFRVSDSGVGIPPEECDKIFDRFYQVDSSKARRFEGVGLGLYIVKSFTEMLGGRVSVCSELGKGSTFTVSLPIEKPP
jgi:signal transduction histidine kinase